MSASLLQNDDGLSIDRYLTQLEDARLVYLRDPDRSDDPESSVQASLQLSYDALESTPQIALRQLGVFRASFDLEAVLALVQGVSEVESVLSLLRRRSLLEVISDRQEPEYYLHSLVREMLPHKPAEEAAAHAAAAEWFLSPDTLMNWDEGLYHLRSAAEIGLFAEYFEPYKKFVFDNDFSLQYAGWGRRLIREYLTMLSLTEDLAVEAIRNNSEDTVVADYYNIKLRLGENLLFLHEYEYAAELFRERVGFYSELLSLMEDDDTGIPRVTEGLYYSQKRLVEALFGLESTEHIVEAIDLVTSMENLSRTLGNVESTMDLLEIRYQIARKMNDTDYMLSLAERYLARAKALTDDNPSMLNKDMLGGAYFKMGQVYLISGKLQQAQDQIILDLRIKLEINKLPGVAAGLSNLWVTSLATEPEIAPALFLTAEQMHMEMGILAGWTENEGSHEIQNFLSDSDGIELGRAKIESISDQLLPFYERALNRRFGASVYQ